MSSPAAGRETPHASSLRDLTQHQRHRSNMANHAQASVSLRHSLRIRMVILATCAIMLVGAAFLFFVLRPIAEKIAEQQFGNAAREVIDRLDQIFDPAERILRISHAWIEKSPPEPTIRKRSTTCSSPSSKPCPSQRQRSPARLPGKAGCCSDRRTAAGSTASPTSRREEANNGSLRRWRTGE